ncbi:heat shock 70 kDa protein 12B-like [Mytilus trossulus]|uniref:heat shock 70 kDa protein 12B-like n=1 Tax=Mytilus trossulus TaxID=6551 RepID=UPI003005B580
MTQTTDNCILVAAIDFGTSYSGYAFSTRNDFEKDPLQIQVNPPWAAGTRQLLSLKTPTCLLLDADKNYVAFGYDAEDKYSELALLKDHKSYYYFQRFKMSLYQTQNLNKDLVVEDMTGKQFSAFDVCCLSIKALKDHLLESISKQFINMNIDDIRWVLTVPAIWTDSAKQFMRRSAEKAGIPSDKLQISLEPEAASIYCQHLPIENLKGAGKRLSATVAGTRCIIADLGGGTLDITVHEKMNDGRLKEICRASGNNCGGTCVDVQFYKMMETIIGPETFKAFKQDNLDSYIDLSREFEIKKRNFQPDNTGYVTLLIPLTVLDLVCNKHLNLNFKKALDDSEYGSVTTILNDKLRIEVETFRAIFEPTIIGIVGLIAEIMKRSNADSDTQILLVGGFSGCNLVQRAIKATFPAHNIIVPYDSDVSVLKGAVIFGHQPNIISERISKYTYGFSKRKIFDQQKHDSSHLEIVDGKERCSRVFEPIIKRDEIVPVGKKITSTAKCKPDDDGLFTLCIYQTESENPIYTDEDGCSLLGTIHAQLPSPSPSDKIKVELIFGGTEISVKIRDTASRKKCEETIQMI